MSKELPKTYEEAIAEIKRKDKKWKKRKEQIAFLAMLAILLGLVVGSLLGYQSGYHSALVDFKLIGGLLV